MSFDHREVLTRNVIKRLLAGGLPLIVYLCSASGYAHWLDAGEFVAAAADFGISHPPGHPLASLVLGSANLLPGVVRRAGPFAGVEIDPEHRIETQIDSPPRADGDAVWAGIRPENLKIDVGRGEGVPIGKGDVQQVTSDGALCTVTLRWAGASSGR